MQAGFAQIGVHEQDAEAQAGDELGDGEGGGRFALALPGTGDQKGGRKAVGGGELQGRAQGLVGFGQG